MRYIIYGAGAIGGSIGGRLAAAGQEVVLICRGGHLAAIQRDGLRVRTPEGDIVERVAAVSHPREIEFRPDDAVILTMKTQDTERALLDLELAAPPDIAVVCCQNGVENERLAARRFANVYAMLVQMAATFLEDGVVLNECTPYAGTLDLGRYPSGSDATAEQIAAGLTAAKFVCRPDPALMRLKYTKLLANLSNGIEVVTGERRNRSYDRLSNAMRDEAIACYQAAGIDWMPEPEYRPHTTAMWKVQEIPGAPRVGGSTWQSVLRGNTTIEADYLNGEVVLLGSLHGVPTPVNSLIRTLANRIAAEGGKGGFRTVADLEAELALPAATA